MIDRSNVSRWSAVIVRLSDKWLVSGSKLHRLMRMEVDIGNMPWMQVMWIEMTKWDRILYVCVHYALNTFMTITAMHCVMCFMCLELFTTRHDFLANSTGNFYCNTCKRILFFKNNIKLGHCVTRWRQSNLFNASKMSTEDLYLQHVRLEFT